MKMQFSTSCEPWTTYTLADGTEVRVKAVLVSAKRRDNEYAPNGDPMYDLMFQQIINVDAPDSLKLVVPQPQSGARPN